MAATLCSRCATSQIESRVNSTFWWDRIKLQGPCLAQIGCRCNLRQPTQGTLHASTLALEHQGGQVTHERALTPTAYRAVTGVYLQSTCLVCHWQRAGYMCLRVLQRVACCDAWWVVSTVCYHTGRPRLALDKRKYLARVCAASSDVSVLAVLAVVCRRVDPPQLKHDHPITALHNSTETCSSM